jgi:hypothetical protein
MTARFLATTILEVYSNGHVKEGSKKLEYEDFLQLVYMAKGTLLYDIFQQEALHGLTPTISSMLNLYPLKVEKDDKGRKFVELPGEVVTLPDSSGVYSIVPVYTDNINSCSPIIPSEAGSEWAICRDDSGTMYYILYGKITRFYNMPDNVTEVEATLILNDEDSDIPYNLAFKIASLIWREVLRTIALPIDKTNDGNPNIDDALKTKLSAGQLNT